MTIERQETEDHKGPGAKLENQAANELLHCVRQDIPSYGKNDPGNKSDEVFELGKSGDDWTAGRVFSNDVADRPPGGVSLYELKMDGKTYVDFIQPNDTSVPGQDTVSWFKSLKIGENGHAVTRGSEEYNKIVERIHNQHLFDSCKPLTD